jgi:2-polyprenyl-3-methyl-5-hydroxy-6-metoxy-1,4-benzoquinol methylase
MSDDSAEHDTTSYVAWKGWVNDTPFGELERGDAQYFRSELRSIVKSGTPINDVLEVGYGNGAFLAYCRSLGWNVTGTELDPELVAVASRAGYNVLSAQDAAKLANDSFDLIVLFDVLEHIPQDAIVDFLSQLASKLRPGGRMLMRFPNADSWLGNPLQNGDPTHATAIGYLKMTYFALQSSLTFVSFRGAHPRGFGTSVVHGIYSLTAGPLVHLVGLIQRAILFPLLPVILWASNVVCVLERPA